MCEGDAASSDERGSVSFSFFEKLCFFPKPLDEFLARASGRGDVFVGFESVLCFSRHPFI